ncbi:MAG TPA: type II toxin-antitoxin system RelE/ParE family toxin [Thermodesulfobacteriota bacterium]|nr:type II toxin-antitoxin system RelE/ParE family toxin [Thermodesulfobacteriota bacterium]
MNWKIEVKPTAEKYYRKLNKPTKKRIKEALRKLEESNNPLFHENVRALTGELKGDYRLRVGDWRIMFTLDRERKVIYVYAILPRGEAYKD